MAAERTGDAAQVAGPGGAGPEGRDRRVETDDAAVLASAEVLCRLGLTAIWLCGPNCDAAAHGREGHPPGMSGKIPLRAGWQNSPRLPWEELRRGHRPGCNVGVLCGPRPADTQGGGPPQAEVVCVDLDGQDEVEWARRNLPTTPLRVTTGRDEGGEHWYYRLGAAAHSRNFQKVGHEIQVQSAGRQVVAPGSTHRTGRRYAAAPESDWSPAGLAAAPVYDPAWFAQLERRPVTAQSGSHCTYVSQRDSQREFTRADFVEAHERALALLSSEQSPVSIFRQGGDAACWSICLAVLRGFPLATRGRLDELARAGRERAQVDPQDALLEARALILDVWSPRCRAQDGVSPYPWSPDEIERKLADADRADRLPGPDYWLFDDPEFRERWRTRYGASAIFGAAPAPRGDGDGIDGDVVEGAGRTGSSLPGRHPSGMSLQAVAYAATTRDRLQEEYLADPRRFAGVPDWAEECAAPQRPERERQRPPARGLASRCDEVSSWATSATDRPARRYASVLADGDLVSMALEAEYALSHHPRLFVHDGHLCEVLLTRGRDEFGDDLPPAVRRVPHSYLVAVLNDYAEFYRIAGDGEEERAARVPVPPRTATVVQEMGAWPNIPVLNRIAHAPFYRRDLTLCQVGGYDPQTGIYYHPHPTTQQAPLAPGRRECARALASLMTVLSEFPLARPELGRAVWLSAVLTRFLRLAFEGNHPMFLVSGNEAGVGKGKIVDTAAIISDGVPCEKTSRSQKPDVSDMEDGYLFAAMLADPNIQSVCIDNIREGTPLASTQLEMLLTTKTVAGRKVRTSEMIRERTDRIIWWATGCNLKTGGDISRRTLRIEIDDVSGDPKRRETKIDELERFVSYFRGQFVRCALTLIQGWIRAGKPRADLPRYGGFAGWADLVRQIVVWCGLPDPVEAVGSEADDDRWAKHRTLIGHLLAVAATHGSPPDQPRPRGRQGAGEGQQRRASDPARAGRDVPGAQRRLLVGQLAALLARPDREHAGFAAFLIDESVKLTGTNPSVSLGRFLSTYKGKAVQIRGQAMRIQVRHGDHGSEVWIEVVSAPSHEAARVTDDPA